MNDIATKAKTAVEKKLRRLKMEVIKLEENLLDYEAKIKGRIDAIEKEIRETEADKTAAVQKEINKMKEAEAKRAEKLKKELAEIEGKRTSEEEQICHRQNNSWES
jgi:hypothetical protein